jgi:protein tyrosine phosphatase
VDQIKIKSLKDFDTNLYGLRERSFELTDKEGNVRNITQLNFTGWPDHGVPNIDNVFDTFTDMIKRVKEHLDLYKDTSPVIVHCSAGVGRTGTFMSMYTLTQEINKQLEGQPKSSVTVKFNVWNTVRHLKEQRILSVENFHQYQFIYKFIGKILKNYFK